MGKLLRRHIPEPGQTDWRGFEWHVFRRLSEKAGNPIRTLPLRGAVWDLAATPDGQTVAALIFDHEKDRAQVTLWDAATGWVPRTFDGPHGGREGTSSGPWPSPRTDGSSPRGADSITRAGKAPSSTSGTRRRANCGRAWAAPRNIPRRPGPGLLARRQDAGLGSHEPDDQALGPGDRPGPHDRGARRTSLRHQGRRDLDRRPPDRLGVLRQDGEALGRASRRRGAHLPSVRRGPRRVRGLLARWPIPRGGELGTGPGCGT